MQIITSSSPNLNSHFQGDEEKEIINSSDMIWDSLKSNIDKIGAIKPITLQQVEEEMSGGSKSSKNEKRSLSKAMNKKVTTDKTKSEPVKKNEEIKSEEISTEKLLVSLFDIYDNMIVMFEEVGIDSNISKNLIDTISYMEDCIRYIGGDVNSFDPMTHVSGLEVPDFYRNAQKVVDLTVQCYRIGKVIDPNILDSGRTINIAFSGVSRGVSYVANGMISSDAWLGNEAIDYVYTPEGGKMSVKIFENGKWTDKSDTGNYKIEWELEERDGTATDDMNDVTCEVSDEQNEDEQNENERIENERIENERIANELINDDAKDNEDNQKVLDEKWNIEQESGVDSYHSEEIEQDLEQDLEQEIEQDLEQDLYQEIKDNKRNSQKNIDENENNLDIMKDAEKHLENNVVKIGDRPENEEEDIGDFPIIDRQTNEENNNK